MKTEPSKELICERLRDELTSCPVCWAGIMETNDPSDHIPSDQAFEHVFDCGSRVAVMADGSGYRVSNGCPDAGMDELRGTRDNVMEALRKEMADD